MPLRILRVPGLISSSIVRGFLVTGMYSTFFLGTLYLEHVLHYGALQTGLAYLPWTLSVAALSLGITARLVGRFGADPRSDRGHARRSSPASACSPPSGRTRASSRPSSWPTSPSVSGSEARSCRCSRSPWPTSRPPRPVSPPGSSTFPSRSPPRSASPCSARSPPTAPTRWRRPTIRRSDQLLAGDHLAFAIGATAWPSASSSR